jgi:predicted NAD/FAD-dependent oxidoreductase
MTIQRFPFAIIGSGMAGITLAQLLGPENCLLVDKSRGIGGRLAGRRLGDVTFNHGAREMVPTHPWLKDQALAGVKNGTLRTTDEHKFIPVAGINTWVKQMAQDLSIVRECRIERIERDASGDYRLLDSANELRCLARAVVLAVPAPQAGEILKSSGLELTCLNQVAYQSILEVMAFSQEGLVLPQLPELSFSSIEMPKNYYHFESNVEADFDQEQFRIELQARNTGAEIHVHKWKYGLVTHNISAQYQIALAQQNIYLVGDYFVGSDLNAAISSAHHLYQALKAQLTCQLSSTRNKDRP